MAIIIAFSAKGISLYSAKVIMIGVAEDIKKNQNLLPGILKSNTLGYDGKGQFVLNSLDDVKKDWCFTADYILEKKINLKK